jgi:hypothetical protein
MRLSKLAQRIAGEAVVDSSEYHGRPQNPPSFGRSSYVRNNAISDSNGSRGPQALQHPKKKQGSITILDCESNICSNVDTE